MSKKYDERIRRNAFRNENIAKGMCVNCGLRPPIKNWDGRIGLTCENCRTKRPVKQTSRPRPPMTSDGDLIDFRTLPVFLVYKDTVQAIIEAASGISSREIKAELGELNNDHYTAAALEQLVAHRHIEEVGVCWIRYRKAKPKPKAKPVAIDPEKVKEYKAYDRAWKQSYPTTAMTGWA